MRRAHQLAERIEQSSREHRPLSPPIQSTTAVNPVGGKVLLDALEQLDVDDRRVFTLVDQVLVHDLAEVDAIAQEVEQRAATEMGSAKNAAVAGHMALRHDPIVGKRSRQPVDRTDCEVPLKEALSGQCGRIRMVVLARADEPQIQSQAAQPVQVFQLVT